MRDDRLLIGYCSRGNDLFYKFPLYLLKQQKIFPNMGVIAVQNGWRPAHEEMFNALMNSELDWEYIHLLDADVIPADGTTEILIDTGLDLVTAPVWFFHYHSNDIHLNIHYTDQLERVHKPKTSGVEKITSTSLGNILIRRNVLEEFKKRGESFVYWSDMLPEVWRPMPTDNIFFQKTRRMGFDLHVCWDAPIGEHHKLVSLTNTTLGTFVNNVTKYKSA